MPEVLQVLQSTPFGFPLQCRIWEAMQPEVLLHGHMHVRGQRAFDDGPRIIALNCNEQPEDWGVLDPQSLDVAVPQLAHQ